MGYQVLARKYRPQKFSDVVGQDHVTRTLMNALSQNRMAHGYIFSGHRGIGKTTIARILAQALNCRTEIGSEKRPTPEPCGDCDSCTEIRQGSAVDVIEIDAATNRGIDEIRELRDAARYAPARDKYKVYILDEAHQITDAAFNALLKTLEEPPAHVIFMMATTEPENIPQTIRSRCQHFSFHAVKFDDILMQLKMIAAQESVEAEDAALALLAEAGDGSMRDALSIMDQAIASAPFENGKPVLAAVQIRDLMGSVPNAVFEKLLEAISAGQSTSVMDQLDVLLNAGHSPSTLSRQIVRYLRNALMAKLGGENTELLQISGDERNRASRTAALFTEEELTRNLQSMLRTFDELNNRQEQRFHLELGLIKLIHAQRLLPLEELLSGVALAPSRPTAPTATTPSSTPRATRPAPAAPAVAPQKSSPLSPFGPGGGNWSAGPKLEVAPKPADIATPIAPVEIPAPAAPAPIPEPTNAAPFSGITPFPAASTTPAPAISTETEGSLAKAPEVVSSANADVDSICNAVVAALAEADHSSASNLLSGSNWIIDGPNLRIEAPGMGKKMIALTVNAAAEKIIRQELQKLGAPTRFMVVPCEGDLRAVPRTTTPIAGSIQEAALSHPLVQQAKEIFNAEIRSVVDLRKQ